MSPLDPRHAAAVIFGCAGTSLTDAERRLFADADPFGFILFARNVAAPDQARELVAGLRSAVGRHDAPVLIDQEGGRVARLGPPHWRVAPAAADLGALALRDPDLATEAVALNSRLIAAELSQTGVTVDCLPVLDLPAPGAHDVIGTRAYGREPALVARLGRAACEGLLAGGVLPVIKHLPGHGRALVDSHHHLPVVTAERAALEDHDFRPFRALNDMPWGMTAHVVYAAIDPEHPATQSARVIGQVIRGWIGFDGLLLSDDICMAALSGTPGERARRAVAAGCDVVLHCDGRIADMEAVAAAGGPMTEKACHRAACGRAPAPADVAFDSADGETRLARLTAAATEA